MYIFFPFILFIYYDIDMNLTDKRKIHIIDPTLLKIDWMDPQYNRPLYICSTFPSLLMLYAKVIIKTRRTSGKKLIFI